MKKIKYISFVFALLLLVLQVNGYSNGDTVELPSGGMDVSGAIFKFSLPQGDYPADSKLVIYAQKDVLCPFPGFNPEPPTTDKNPYTLLAEYNFTSTDISNLKNGETQLQVTTKFDPECGAMYAKIVASGDTVKENDNSNTERPSGENSSSDVELTKYTDGMQVNVSFEVVGSTLMFTVPQASFTLADYFIVVDENNTVVLSTIITEEIMNNLANGDLELIHVVANGLDAANLKLFVSDTSYEVGTTLDVDLKPNENPNEQPSDDQTNNTNNTNNNPLFVGLGVFVLVLAIGFAGSYYEKLKKSKAAGNNK